MSFVSISASSVLSSSAAPWVGLVALIGVLLVIDLFIVRGRGGAMSLRQAGVASVCWVAISLAFFGLLLLLGDAGDAKSYLAGYLVEKSLSLDNVFVFLLVFSAFAVPVAERHRLLTYGIVGALVLRAVFIVAGAAALNSFSWLSFIFAAILIWTGVRMWRHRHDHDSERDLVEKLATRLPVSTGDPQGRLVRREGRSPRDGDSGAGAGRARWVLTTSGAALVGIALVDLLFAVDSVPAILAITSDSFIVFAANAFALLGLRPLFFLVAELVQRLYYLKTALAALLVFIGLKLVAAEFMGKIGPEISLPAIALILGAGVVASLIRNRRMGSSGSGDDRPGPAVAGPGPSGSPVAPATAGSPAAP